MQNLIVFKEDLLPPSETFILAQTRNLSRYSPCLVGLEPAKNSLAYESKSVLLSSRRSVVADLRSKAYRRVPIAPQFHSKVKRLGGELIHAHFASGGKTALRLKRILGLPLVVTLHGGSDVPQNGQEMYRELFSEADLFICVSDFIRQKAIEAGYPKEKLKVHYIGVDRTIFFPVPEPPEVNQILFVGRLVEKKGCEYLLFAMEKVMKKHSDVLLTVVGTGPLKERLGQLAAELSINCRFLGVQSSQSIRDLLRNSRLFCLPSVTPENGDCEGLPIALLEAQAMGVPVVSTFHAGIPEGVAHEGTGVLVPEKDTEQLAEAILRLIEDRAQWASFHRATQSHIDRSFNLRRQTAQLEEIYTQCCA